MPYTPMMQQYFGVKDNYKDYLLFYRLGDFYEMFFDDAITASKELELTLTGRDCGMEERAPMCGVPFHSADGYIAKLVKKGYKVAICEQLEDPATTKNIVKRDVIRIITPGTVTEGSLLTDGKNNYLCSIYCKNESAGFAVADISTAEIYVTDFSGNDLSIKLLNELGLYAPSEIISNLPKEDNDILSFSRDRLGASCNFGEDYRYSQDFFFKLKKQFGDSFPNSFGIPSDSPAVLALGALIDYLVETQKTDISYINNLNYYSNEQFMQIDINTRRNLELCETMREREKKGSLLGVLDKTKTAMGARLLRKWLEQPLLSCNLILKRQQAIQSLFEDAALNDELSLLLTKIGDIERLMTKVVYNTANGRDLKALENAIKQLPNIKNIISNFSCPELVTLYDDIDLLTDISDIISKSIVDDPPFSVREGGIIKKGFNETIDELHSLMGEGKEWITKIEQTERELTGIKTLKVGYNRVFGYYIEVTNSYISQVPERYVRKQTLTGAERYITEELKEMESRVLSAQDKAVVLEYELFQKVRQIIAENIHRIQKTANAIAKADVYASLSHVARKNNYICPQVDYSDKIEIRDGRHPIVESFLPKGMFIPNDTHLSKETRLMLITGPNMAGKSTYMRQTALIILMAQAGSFVPCSEAHIGVVDRLFTRVGASDDLASGQSTFMLEMNEVAYILKNATPKSFIIYDEIGRGTSTFDGMSIARAVAEYTASKKLSAKTMLATHYHELTELEGICDGIVNYNIAAKKRGDELIFLRKIVKGAADDSYGIEVAKLAGVPQELIKRAKEILESLEKHESVNAHTKAKQTEDKNEFAPISFEDMAKSEIIEKLKMLNIDTLTPIEALTKLYELQRMLDK